MGHAFARLPAPIALGSAQRKVAMRKDIASIVIGVAAMAVSFCPFIPIQLIGAVAAVVGFRLAREARREDYRRDLTCSIGTVAAIAGVVLCLLTPVVYLVGQIILLVAG